MIHAMRPDKAGFNRARRRGFVLVEVLLSMTILAIAGTVIMRSLANGISATKNVRDLSKVVFLTEAKLHELEMQYDRLPVQAATLGQIEGRFKEPGTESFYWIATVEIDRDAIMYYISVTTMQESQRYETRQRRSRRDELPGFTLNTIVPSARINESLVMGLQPGMRENRSQNRHGGQRGGERGSSLGGGGQGGGR